MPTDPRPAASPPDADHDTPSDSPLKARLCLVAAAVLFSTGGAAIKSLTLSGEHVATLRSLVAALAILALVPASRRIGGTSKLRLLGVGIAYATTLVLFVMGNKLTTAANTIFLQSTAPLYLALLSPWLLKEPLRARDLGFLGALAVGFALFFVGQEPPRESAPDPSTGNILAAIAGLTWSFTLIGMRTLSRGAVSGGSDTGSTAVVTGNLIAFVAVLPFAWPLPIPPMQDIAILLYLGVFQIGVAYLFLLRGLRHVTALESSLLLLLEPVLNPVWAFLVHGERPSAFAIAGSILILVATASRAVFEARRAAT